MNVVRELVAAAREMVADFNSPGLNGMRKKEASKFVNKLIERHTKGLFSDDSWKPVRNIFDDLERHSIVPVVTDTRYDQNERGVPVSKTWKFEISFVNEKGRETTLYGYMVASGAGTVDSPLSKYDLVAYVS